MTDCHSHLLPGVDDGVQTLSESLELLSLMEQQGIRRLWLTPHIMEDIPNTTDALQRKFRELRQAYAGPIELRLAAEYMLDCLFEERLAHDDLLPLDEGRRYLLVETSYFSPPIGLLSLLRSIRTKGYHPLLAHPERYVYMQPSDYRQLHDEQVTFQLNLPSLAGRYGQPVQEKARKLLKAGMYTLTGSDTHSADSYRYMLTSPLRRSLVRTLMADGQLHGNLHA